MATATFRSSRKERSSDRGRGFFDRFLVRAGHDVALDLRSEAWETNWWVGTTSGCFGLGVLPRLRAVQFNSNFQPRRDAIVFGETGGEFAVLK